MNDIYNRIAEQAEKKGINGKQLGEMLGLKKSPMTDWKNQKSSPTLEQLMKMCEIFATSSDYLIFGHEPNYIKKDSSSDISEDFLISSFRNLPDSEKEELVLLVEIKNAKVSGKKLPHFEEYE